MAPLTAHPVKIKASPNLRFRSRIPKDVLSKARGQTVASVGDETLRCPSAERRYEVIVSLRTSDHRTVITEPVITVSAIPVIGPLPTTCRMVRPTPNRRRDADQPSGVRLGR